MNNFLILIVSLLLFTGCFNLPVTYEGQKDHHTVTKYILNPMLVDGNEFQVIQEHEELIEECINISDGKLVRTDSRPITRIPDLSSIMTRAAKLKAESVFEVCVTQVGKPAMSRLKSTNLTDQKLLDELLMISLIYRYKRSETSACLECGNFTFKMDIDR